MYPNVAVVILNWNGCLLLERFLPSVLRSQYPNFKLYVADNASTDNSITFLNTNYPEVEIIQNSSNLGFAEGYNQALNAIDADYFVLLNSDVEVSPNWLSVVIELMQQNPKIAIAQPKIKYLEQKDQFEYAGAAGGYIDRFGFTFCRGRLFDVVETDTGQYDTNQAVFWASGAAFFIRAAIWRSAGGLDKDLFAHMEEIDLCWRVKNMGYEVYSCNQTEVYHLGGGTLNAISPFKTYLNFRNNLVIMQKNLNLPEACFKIFVRLWFDLAAWFQFAAKGNWAFAFAINKAHTHFFRDLFKNAKKRSSSNLQLSKHQGVFNNSVVWQFFIRRKKIFSQLRKSSFS